MKQIDVLRKLTTEYRQRKYKFLTNSNPNRSAFNREPYHLTHMKKEKKEED